MYQFKFLYLSPTSITVVNGHYCMLNIICTLYDSIDRPEQANITMICLCYCQR